MSVKLISRPAKHFQNCLNQKSRKKHNDRDICNRLEDKDSCDDKCVVYKFVCNLCGRFYIGQTSRPFHLRYNEHSKSLANKDKTSAVSALAVNVHKVEVSIKDFDVSFIDRCRSPVESRISEAPHIDRQRPNLNRREELTQW